MTQRAWLALFVAVLIPLLSPRPAAAENPSEGLIEISPVIGGAKLSCQDFRGVVVRTTRMTDLGDVGRAWFIQRMPVIALDPDRLAALPPKMQIFFYNHECAHHVLGHYFNRTMLSESEADCWAINSGRQNSLFTRADVEGFAPFLAHSRGSPFGHLPGPERAAFLVSCFDDPKSIEHYALNR